MTTSYLQNNDYKALDYLRPYESNYAGALQELSAKTQYWQQGMQRIKSAYDKIADVNPSFAIGKEYVNNFKQEASKKLDAIAKTDVSIADNSLAAFDIIKPLYDRNNKFNEAVLKDDALRKHYAEQDELIENYKKAGKQYNPNNEYVYNLGKKAYVDAAKNSKDYSALDGVISKKSVYTPYYDQSAEIIKLKESCEKGGMSTDKQDVDGDYFRNEKHSGLDAKQMGLCISLGKSSSAKEQDKIDGIAYYRQNPLGLQVLVRDFEKMNGIDEEQITELTGQIQAYESVTNKGEDPKETKKRLEVLKQAKDGLAKLKENQIKNKASYTKLYSNAGTYKNPNEFIEGNFDYLAGTVYSSTKATSLGEAFRNDHTTNKLMVNQMRIAEYNFLKQFELNKQEQGYAQENIILKGNVDASLAEGAGRLKGFDAKGKPIYKDPVVLPGVTDASQKDVSLKEEELSKEITTLSNTAESQKKTLREIRLSEDPNAQVDVTSLDAYHSEQVRQRGRGLSYNEAFVRNYEAMNDTRRQYKSKLLIQEGINATLKESLSSKKEPIDVGNGRMVNLSQKDIYEIVNNGKTIEGVKVPKIITDSKMSDSGGYLTLTPESEEYDFRSPALKSKYNDIARLLKPKKDKLFEELKTNESVSYTQDPLMTSFKKDSPKDLEIRSRLPASVTGGLNENNGYKYVASTSTGEGIYVVLLDKDGKDITPDKSVDNAANKGFFNANDKSDKLPGYGNAVLINNINPRYEGLPDTDEKLQRINTTTRDLHNLFTVVKANFNPKLNYEKSTSLRLKDDVPHPLSFISMLNTRDLTHDITIIKEGDRYYYNVERYMPGGKKDVQTFPIDPNNITQSAALLATSINK